MASASGFVRSEKYDDQMVRQRSRGGNVLYATECLAREMDLKPGMRLLDLGCGMALSSVFLAREYGVEVIAIDKYFPPDENYRFACAYGCGERVVPLQLDVRQLPFPRGYFDCIVAVNSYTYYGTDDKYLPYICRFLQTGGRIGISDICFTREMERLQDVPDYLKADFPDHWYHIHSPQWWAAKWEKTGLLDHITPALVPERDEMKRAYLDYARHTDDAFAAGLKKDDQDCISFFYMTGIRNNKEAFLEEEFG